MGLQLEPTCSYKVVGRRRWFFDYTSVPPEVAGEELVNMIVSLKFAGVISAKQACVLAYWASKAGSSGHVSKLAMRPDQASGEYSRHFDTWTLSGTDSLEAYTFACGRRLHFEVERRFDHLPCRLLHEALGDELVASDARAKLHDAIEHRRLPDQYFNHPAVFGASAESMPHPYCIYLDAVAYTRADEVLGVFAYFVLTGRRHLLFCIRKSEVCNCGCKGYCSLFPILDVLAWSAKNMLLGKHPSRRHDDADWRSEDAARASYAGSQLGWSAVCLFLKCDWGELVHSLGFFSWDHAMSPCPVCFATM